VAGVVQTVNCPAVDALLPAVPAGAQAEVDRNLALLNTQIAEANTRLAGLAVRPEGGPAFIQNAILGPLKDKRVATLNRISIAIGRITKVQTDLTAAAGCSLNAAGSAATTAPATTAAAAPAAAATTTPAAGGGAVAGVVQTVNCPAVDALLPAVPTPAWPGWPCVPKGVRPSSRTPSWAR
jgi:hypothetical protein